MQVNAAVMPAALKPPEVIGVTPPAQFSWVFYLFRAITGILACWSKCPGWQLTPISQDQLYLEINFVRLCCALWILARFVVQVRFGRWSWVPSNVLTVGE